MAQKDLGEQVKATYTMLRLGLAVLAFAFPPLLWIGGEVLGGLPLAGSMSAYYHASDPLQPESGPAAAGVMRNEFVGILFAVSGLLIVYQGYSRFEDQALNLAGIFALGVALIPMKWPGRPDDGWFSLHGSCAAAFFLCIAYVCIFRAGDTLSLVPDDATRRKYLDSYRALGAAMVLLPTLAWLVSGVTHGTSGVFWVELLGIYVFAVYWVVKSHEAAATDVDGKAARGEVRARPHGLADALRPLPVIVDETP